MVFTKEAHSLSARVLFMGTPSFATTVLENLLANNFDIVGLFTQPDKKIGRKQVLTYPHIKQYCLETKSDIKIYQPQNLKDSYDDINSLKPDFIVVVAYGQILPQNILNIAPCINLHASVLPRYRGASPIQQAVLNDDKQTGVSAQLMDTGLDSGDILAISYIKISGKNSAELFETLSRSAGRLITYVLNDFATIKPQPQLHSEATYCSKIVKSHGIVQFDSSVDIYNKYRAYIGWPGIAMANGSKIIKCDIHDTKSKNQKGKIIAIEKEHIKVACSEGILNIYTVQPSGKKPMNVVDYTRGKRQKVGDNFE